ncbi:MAG TPA: hypothetical protein VJN90_08575 [Candidatus Acidoferrales bacterium]|nr:hypothetical protein [Candidatus Acidoferrales bacterium]
MFRKIKKYIAKFFAETPPVQKAEVWIDIKPLPTIKPFEPYAKESETWVTTANGTTVKV